MAAKSEATLISDIAASVLSGGRRTKAANVRALLADVLDSYANIVDGGNVYQTEVGYTSDLAISGQYSFVHKKWVEDNFVPMGGIGSLSQTLAVGNTTGGYNILMSGSDVIADSAASFAFLDLNNTRLYFTDGFNNYSLQSDLSGGTIEMSVRDIVSVTLEQSYVQALVNGINIGCYSQSTGNETKIQLGTIFSTITSTYASYAGLEYAADYSANYTSRSLVDKGYVTGVFVPYTGAAGDVTLGAYSLTTPLIIGGTAVGSGISYKGTSGNGTSTLAAHTFLVGNDGATTALVIKNNGNIEASAGNIILADSTATTNIIYKGANYFLHNFKHPTGSTAVPQGFNLFLGENAGNLTTGSTATSTSHGSRNVALGREVMLSITQGYRNVGVGDVTMRSITTGAQNVAIGNEALYSITTSNNNVAIGNMAGRYLADGSTANTDSGTSIYIGASTKANAATMANEIVIGYNAIGNGSNTSTLGNTSTTNNYIYGNFNIIDKNIILGTTTGTKIGTGTTQKISFWNKTPIVQPTTSYAAASFVAGAGTAVNDASTFDGYTLKQVVAALRGIGLLA